MPKKMLCLLLPVLLVTGCAMTDKATNLVQPDKWWKVHPRPVYASLEKVGTYQNWFDVYKLCEGTYAIYEPNQFEEALCYLVTGLEKAIMIDAGNGIGDVRKLAESLTDLPISMVLTHEHYDHVAAAYQFEDIAHYDNADALAVLKRGRDNASMQKYLAPDYFWKPPPAAFNPDTWHIPSITPNKLFRDGDTIDLGDRELEVIYTPGHSPGSACLLDKKNRILFTGDHFFPGPLYAHAADVNLDDYIASNKKLCARLDEFDYLCSGHNDPWVKSEVLLRVGEAFDEVLAGGGKYSENEGLRRYYYDGFDILILTEMIEKN